MILPTFEGVEQSAVFFFEDGTLGEFGGGGEPFGDGGLPAHSGKLVLQSFAHWNSLFKLDIHAAQVFLQVVVVRVIPDIRPERLYSLSTRQDEDCAGIGVFRNVVTGLDAFLKPGQLSRVALCITISAH